MRMRMENKDPQFDRLTKEIDQLKYRILKLENMISLLNRENNRRKTEINQLISAVKRK